MKDTHETHAEMKQVLKLPFNMYEGLPPFDVEVTIKELVANGLLNAAREIYFMYVAWTRTTEAYRNALPFLSKEDQVKMTVVTTTVKDVWGPKILGTPVIDNEAVMKEHLLAREHDRIHNTFQEGV